MLDYDSQRLNLSTLKAQIVDNQKPFIMSLLHNVEDMIWYDSYAFHSSISAEVANALNLKQTPVG